MPPVRLVQRCSRLALSLKLALIFLHMYLVPDPCDLCGVLWSELLQLLSLPPHNMVMT